MSEDQKEKEEAAGKKKSRRGLHMKEYWEQRRLQEQRFNVYRMPPGAADVLLYVRSDGLSMGIEIEGMLGIFAGNFQFEQIREIEKQAKREGYELVEQAYKPPRSMWHSMAAKRMWADPAKRERLLENLKKARKKRAENLKRKR